MKKIKNIIFDLGGVLFGISGQETLNAFEKHGAVNVMDKYKELIDSELFHRFEIGTASPDEFRKGICAIMGVELGDTDFDGCWNAMITSYPAGNNDFLEKLKAQGYNLYILSNTNKIHVDYLEPISKWRPGLFTKIYYSNEINSRKPDLECFEWVINDAKIDPEETVFIDDRADNIEGALSAGINTIHLTNINDLYEKLDNYLK